MPEPISVYRRALNSTTWHFCRNCSFWPRIDFEQRHGVPQEGALCGECKVMRSQHACESASPDRSKKLSQ